MGNQKKAQQESKRKTLKAFLGGAGAVAGASALPEKWSKPIISSVVLPAHARTSQCEPLEFGFDSIETSGSNLYFRVGASDEIVGEVAANVEFQYDNEMEGINDEFASELGSLIAGAEFETELDIDQFGVLEVTFDYCEQEVDLETTD